MDDEIAKYGISLSTLVSVSRLKRVRFGPLVLPSSLKVEQHLVLSEEDTEALCGSLGSTIIWREFEKETMKNRKSRF